MDKIKGTPRQGLIAATAGFFVGFAAVALFGTTAQKLNSLLQMTPLMIGFLVAVPNLSGSLLRIPFAAWVDTNGGRKPFLILLGLSVLGMGGLTMLMFSVYPDRMTPGMYWAVMILGMLSGCGIATFSVGISQVTYWFPRLRQGSALGIYAGVGNLAPGLFSLLLPLALTQIGLAWSYLIWFLFLVAGTIFYAYAGRNAPYFQYRSQGMDLEDARLQARKRGQESFPAGSMVQSLLLSLKVWKTWVLVIVYFTSFGGFLAMTAWLPTYWKSYLGVSVVTAGGLTALYSLLTSGIRIWGGSLTDRFGGIKIALTALCIMVAGALLMAFSGSLGLSIAGEVLMGIGMGVTNAAVFKLVPQEIPQAVGGASGWVGGLGAFGGFAIPPLLGVFVRNQGMPGYASGFWIFFGLAIISLGVMLLLQQVGEAKTRPATRRAAS
jgi:NNP family nitrate/nitrite transporter-like MFS transporter